MAQGCFCGHGLVASELVAQFCGANLDRLTPGTGVKSSRTCSPVGAIIPKRLVALWEELRNSSLFPQEAEPSHSRCPGLFSGACLEPREAAPLLGMIWEGRNRLGSAAPVPEALKVNAPMLHPSGKPKKKRKIYDQWAVKYSQTVPPEASLPLNLPLPQFPMAWLFQTECATAPGPWWDKYCGHFPHLKWHFQG